MWEDDIQFNWNVDSVHSIIDTIGLLRAEMYPRQYRYLIYFYDYYLAL